MTKEYSVSEAKAKLPGLVREAERGARLRLTRRGKVVAVVLGAHDYARLERRAPGFTAALEAFKKKRGIQGIDIDPAYFDGLRDRSSGREVGF
jgi:prevent-host-death family protein